ncbi:MAG: hypothetical protein ACTSRU_12605 [Candidatus Hodarchaeales archaeon]
MDGHAITAESKLSYAVDLSSAQRKGMIMKDKELFQELVQEDVIVFELSIFPMFNLC